MLNNISDSANIQENPQRPDLLTRLHNVTCILCSLLIAQCLLMCVLAVMVAWDDLRKYGALGSGKSLQCYLLEAEFVGHLGILLAITAEFVLYLVLCRRADSRKLVTVSMVYFSVMAILHVLVLLHAHALILGHPEYMFKNSGESIYRYYANKSLLPAVGYIALFFFRVLKHRDFDKTRTEDGSPPSKTEDG